MRHLIPILLLLATGCSDPWREYQNQYEEAVPGVRLPNEPVVARNVALGVDDRCMNCHVGVTDNRLRDRPQPLRTHPGRYLEWHPPGEYGCTSCHGGDGQAFDEGAHGTGPKAVLTGDLAQTRCTLCHQDHPLEGAGALSRGLAHIERLGCSGCHMLAGVKKLAGPPCPPLTGLGSKVDFIWLKRWLLDPGEFAPGTSMPDPVLTEAQAEALAAYLLSSRDGDLEARPEPPEGDPDAGGKLLRLTRCISCHAFAGKGGHLGPDLGRIGNKARPRWLYYMLRDTHRYLPGTTMPQFRLNETEAADIVAYLLEEFTDYDLLDEYEADTSLQPRDAATVDLGRRIYKEMRCANCHARDTDGWLQLGPILTGIGDRAPAAFDFGTSDIPRTTADYLFEKVRHPRAFATDENLPKMPDFHLSDQEAEEITVALLASHNAAVPAVEYRVSPPLASVYEPPGEAGRLFERYRCLSCHSVRGRGYNLAYDLSVEGSRVQPGWLYDYLKLSYSMRPILVERMPVFRFSAEETQTLSQYISQNLVDSGQIPELNRALTPAMAERGRQIFEARGCLACHQVGERGGYVGPGFTVGAHTGDKLRPAWIYAWLRNPQALVPTAIEPNYGFSDEEALALTAYLMTLRTGTSP